MNKSFPFLFLLSLLFCFSFKSESDGAYEVYLVQGENRFGVNDHNEISLKKAPFCIEIVLQGTEGVHASASLKREYYDTPAGKEFKDWKYISSKTMAEPNFNEEKQLVIDDELICYWWYNPGEDWHRMDKDVKIDGNKTTIKKTVENIYNQDTEKKIKIAKFASTLYLVFFSSQGDQQGEIEKELIRKSCTLKFVD